MTEHAENKDIEPLLDYLKRARGFDFSAYKRASLARRIGKRMQVLNVPDYTAYADYLDRTPDEFKLLFNTILINVTSFFRDPEAWEYLDAQVLPRILDRAGPDGVIRVWSAGCAAGQEPCTVAMLFAERIGIEACRRRLKIYGSDVDAEALTEARHAVYTAAQVQDVPPRLLNRYFDRVQDRYVVHKDLRRCLIFGRHDLLQDPPISRVHLIVCRNTLMYFTREAQAAVLSRFHFALRSGGFLFMGKAELLLTHGELFTPLELRWRVFVRNPGAEREQASTDRGEEVNGTMERDERLEALAVENDATAKIVVRADGTLVVLNGRARTLFRLGREAVGKRLQDLELSYRPVELRSLMEEATAQHRPVVRKNVPWTLPDGSGAFDVHVQPLVDHDGSVAAFAITFADVSSYQRLQNELENSKNELETAYEELQSTNEELETTNEELQSTNEELETTNEELQSTNEELETMNEELQSTNEELETINTELRLRSDDLNHANAFLQSILGGLQTAVIVVDPELRVLAWNHRAEDTWGLRAEEVQGHHLLNLDIGFPVERLRQPIRSLLAGEARRIELTADGRDRRGRVVTYEVSGSLLSGGAGERRGAIVMIREIAPAEQGEASSAAST